MRKKDKKNKFVSLNGLAMSERKDMKRLGIYAARGLVLVGFNIPLLSYRLKAQPSELVDFSVDYQQEADETYFYRQKKAKWEHVFTYKHLHFFKAPIGTKPIFTDIDGKIVLYAQQIKVFFGLFLLGLLFVSTMFWFLLNNINFGYEWLLQVFFLGFTVGILATGLMGFAIIATRSRVKDLAQSKK